MTVEYTDIGEFAELLKPGYAYRLFINDNNPNNKTIHVRAIVDDHVVYAVYSQPKHTLLIGCTCGWIGTIVAG